MLLVGAVLCLTVAVWPLVTNRVTRNREPPYPPSERLRTDGRRLSVAALLSAAAFVAAIWLPGGTARRAQPPIPLPAVGAIGPGAGIAVTYADGSGGMGCTAGFLVRTDTGQAGVLTAGHCNKGGQASKTSINYAGNNRYVTVGTFSQSVSEGLRGEAHDIGLIMLDSDKVPRTSAIAASLPVAGVMADVGIGQQLCKFGMKTGRAECGRVTDISASKVAFLAASQCGDSGGPVYLIQDDGTAAAVGIHIRGGRPDDPNPGCSTPDTSSVAELVQPWLDTWNLSVVTAG
ncbi:trypsin [Mycobacterium lacus]|uniref:Trypsin n=1 Tax=Mycobacterium lacus TaxID=169765 RepID=A0A7I7NKQ3_9MYCO|nr:trypsin [Mycobacterium lacus]